MFCSGCGKRIKDGAKFCPYCGCRSYDSTAVPPKNTVSAAPIHTASVPGSHIHSSDTNAYNIEPSKLNNMKQSLLIWFVLLLCAFSVLGYFYAYFNPKLFGSYTTYADFVFHGITFNGDGTFSTSDELSLYYGDFEYTHNGTYKKQTDGTYELLYDDSDYWKNIYKYKMTKLSEDDMEIQLIYLDPMDIQTRGEWGTKVIFSKQE